MLTAFRFGRSCFVLLSVACLLAPCAAADTISTWTGNAGTGNWNNAGNWSPAQVPNNSGTQVYDVTVNGNVALDLSPTINSFYLGGDLEPGYDTQGPPTLTVNQNVTINGSISPASQFNGSPDVLLVGGNLTNNGSMIMGAGVGVGGNAYNSGTITFLALPSAFDVGGTLVNSGTLNVGQEDLPAAGAAFGATVNTGSIFINSIGPVALGSVTDIPKGASWDVGASSVTGFAPLASIEGTLNLQTTSTIGNNGTIKNTGSFSVGSAYGPAAVTVLGNFSNSGNLVIGTEPTPLSPSMGTNTLNVTGTLINQASGTLNVNNPPASFVSAAGSLNVAELINYGTANFQPGATVTAQVLENSGTLNLLIDPSVNASTVVTVGTLKDFAGVVSVPVSSVNSNLLVVGSGSVTALGFGYYQLSNGTLDYGGGTLAIQGNIYLNGTLDIMLGNNAKPVGTVYDLFSYTVPISGTFSNVEGLIFDDGRQRYDLGYNYSSGSVTLTVENNPTPEPGSVGLVALGIIGILALSAARKFSGSAGGRLNQAVSPRTSRNAF